MAPGSSFDHLIAELSSFEERMRDVAHQLVAEIFAAELRRRAAAGELDDDDDDAEDDASAAADSAADTALAAPPPEPAKPSAPEWTRDRVVTELGTWLLGGNPVEAAFLIRNRQRALVTNAKKFFGRFDAALNAANLHLARQYPEGIPSNKRAPTTA